MRGKSGKTKGHKIEIISVLCPFSVICFRVFGFSCNGVNSVPIFSSDCVKFALFLFGKFFKGNKFFHNDILLSDKKVSDENKGEQPSSFSLIWCGKWDLNPYVKDTRPSNVPVCLFQHTRIFCFCSLRTQQEILYHRVHWLSTVFRKFFLLSVRKIFLLSGNIFQLLR